MDYLPPGSSEVSDLLSAIVDPKKTKERLDQINTLHSTAAKMMDDARVLAQTNQVKADQLAKDIADHDAAAKLLATAQAEFTKNLSDWEAKYSKQTAELNIRLAKITAQENDFKTASSAVTDALTKREKTVAAKEADIDANLKAASEKKASFEAKLSSLRALAS